MVISLVACGRGDEAEATPEPESKVEESREEDEGDQITDSDTSNENILLAYFSATHTTEGVAETMADVLDADVYQIVPEEPYTDADLDYNDDNSRSTIEMKDPFVRPAISGSVENWEEYDTVFIGYPIWWGEAPRILDTFVESYDFTGKTIIPFATSGGSGMGKTNEKLAKSCQGAVLLQGKMLNGGSSEKELKVWAESLKL